MLLRRNVVFQQVFIDSQHLPDFQFVFLAKMGPKTFPSQKNRKFCVAVDCKSRESVTPDVKFFRVLRKDKDQTRAWARAIDRKGENGELWMPKKSDIICSKHFIDGEFSKDP